MRTRDRGPGPVRERTIAAEDVEGGGSAAERHYRGAIAQAEELGMRPLVALCHLALARLERPRGDRRARQTHLDTAAAMFQELGMSFWQERAAAEVDADR